MARYGMVLNFERCIGCYTCQVACKMANGTKTGVDYTTINRCEWGEYPNAHQRYTMNICMHCENAACVAACPVGATSTTEEGVVVVDYDKCIGCGACVNACPYGARTLVTDQGNAYEGVVLPPEQMSEGRTNLVEKCNFCLGRVKDGKQPMCVTHCPGVCRIFGDVDDPESDINKYIADRGAKHVEGTAIWYVAPEGMPEEFLPKTPVEQAKANAAK